MKQMNDFGNLGVKMALIIIIIAKSQDFLRLYKEHFLQKQFILYHFTSFTFIITIMIIKLINTQYYIGYI